MKKILLICLLILACKDESNMATLYKLLTDADVADITAYLKENKYKYKLLESIDKILVQKDSVCKIRMNLAKIGLPRIRGEIFFYIENTEEEQLRAEYFKHREALRTELACAIETLSEVEQVIKITMNLPKRTLFLESEKPSATVIIKLRPNKTLQESQLKSIKHLVLAAGSAEGLKAERVSVSYDTPLAPDSTITDLRDNKTYKTTKIGEQIWMAENLNYNASGSKCYGNNESNCQIYGRLYNWETAKTACPIGWHLPSKAEWKKLTAAVGGEETESELLKSKSGWGSGNGQDKYGFSALPGGCGYYSDGTFGYGGTGGFWWSSSEENGYAYYKSMYIREYAYEYDYDKSLLYSVRCIQNSSTANQLEENTRSKIDIMSVVNQNANELKTIYKSHLKNKPGFAGKVILKFTIAPSGDVTTINIRSSTTDYPEFDNAIKDQVSKWKWQPITDGGNTTPTIPFNFEE